MTHRRLTTRGGAVLAAGFLVLFVGGGSRFAIGLTLKPMAEELSWGRSTLGLAMAVFLVVSACFMFISGRLADRFSLRLILAGGSALGAVGIGSMSMVTAPWQAFLLYGGIFAIGSGMASITPVGVMVTRQFASRTGLANAVVTSGMGVGQLVMISLLAVVLVHAGWRAVYGWLGIFTLVVVPVVLAAVAGEGGKKAASATPRETGMSVSEAIRTRDFRLLAVIYAVCGFQDFFVTTHVVAFAQDRGVDALLAGNLLALMGLTALVGVILTGMWSDRSGPVWATLACFVLRLALFWLILVDQQTTTIATFALLFGSTFLVTAPLTVIFTRDAFGLKNLGALSGLITMIHHMSAGLGAYMGAVLFDTLGNYDMAFALMLVLSIVAVILTMGLLKSRRFA